MRINRYLAQALNISRRKADELVKDGRVKLNGKVLKDFVDVDENDTVEVDGESVRIEKGRKLYFAFYKPPFVVSSTKDSEGRRTVCDFFKGFEQKLICVGRLDYLSEGLLIVTNDGKFANLLMHPKYKVRKTYLIKTRDVIGADLLKRMSKGIELEDGYFKPLTIKKTKNPNWIVVSIDSGRNRILRRFFKAFNVGILKLKRIAIGDVELGSMKEGEYRELEKREVESLKKLAFRNRSGVVFG